MSKVVSIANKRLDEQFKLVKNVLITAGEELNVCYEDHMKMVYNSEDDFNEIEGMFRTQLEELNEAHNIIDLWRDVLKEKIGVGK
jgi:hypothetical protein